MKSNKSNYRVGGVAVLYLLVLLIVVMLYLGIAYPKLNDQINDINQNINALNNEINVLAPYASQLANLNASAEKAEKAYENSKELDKPVMFSNIIYKNADAAGIKVSSLAVSEAGAVEIQGGYESLTYTATISATATNNDQLEEFVLSLEQNQGSGMSVQSVTYTKSESILNAELTVLMYSVNK